MNPSCNIITVVNKSSLGANVVGLLVGWPYSYAAS